MADGDIRWKVASERDREGIAGVGAIGERMGEEERRQAF